MPTTKFQNDGRKRKEIVQVSGKNLRIGTRTSRPSVEDGGSSRPFGFIPLAEATRDESAMYSGAPASVGRDKDGLPATIDAIWVGARSEVRARVRGESGASRIVEMVVEGGIGNDSGAA